MPGYSTGWVKENFESRVQQPSLDREQLEDLQLMLIDVLRERDERYGPG